MHLTLRTDRLEPFFKHPNSIPNGIKHLKRNDDRLDEFRASWRYVMLSTEKYYDGYNQILREADHRRHDVGTAWGLIAVLGVLLIGISSLVHFL